MFWEFGGGVDDVGVGWGQAACDPSGWGSRMLLLDYSWQVEGTKISQFALLFYLSPTQ